MDASSRQRTAVATFTLEDDKKHVAKFVEADREGNPVAPSEVLMASSIYLTHKLLGKSIPRTVTLTVTWYS